MTFENGDFFQVPICQYFARAIMKDNRRKQLPGQDPGIDEKKIIARNTIRVVSDSNISWNETVRSSPF